MTISANLVDYEQVAHAYESGLNTQLRGFRGGARFLEHWVHDPDPIKSIVNIIEAADTAGLGDVTVLVGARTQAALDSARLSELVAKLGQVTTEERQSGLALTVRFARVAPTPRRLGGAARERARRAREAREARWSTQAQKAGRRLRRDGLHPTYREGLAKILAGRLAHEGLVDDVPGLERVEFGRDGWILGALIDPSTHAVRVARFRGGARQTRGLLEGLCSIMENKPLIECADHAVIRLEYRLRDHAKPRPVPGIVVPESADPVFVPLISGVRGLLGEYRRRTGYDETENRFDPEPSPDWQALTHDQRLVRIRTAVNALGAARGLESGTVVCTRLDRDTRATIEFQGEVPAREKARLIMGLERGLKDSVEEAIHLYQEEMRDRNKIRRL